LAPLEPATATVLVPDTNVLIDCGCRPEKWMLDAALGDEFKVLLVSQVIREMDNHKRSDKQDVRNAARSFNKLMKEWERRAIQTGGSIFDGVKVQGQIQVAVDASAPNVTGLPSDLSLDEPDDRILAAVLNHGSANPTHAIMILTNDRLMALKAAKLRLPTTTCE
jgi:predicted ribonuclease YlaK